MKRFYHTILLLLITSQFTFAQNFNITGSVYDSQSNKGLGYANIRVDNSGRGTSANALGEFKLSIPEGNYKLITSYIGYKSDTINVQLNKNVTADFNLIPVELELKEVTVKPGRNPAYDIIEATIENKQKIKSRIKDYQYSAYTKGLIKTTRDFQSGGLSLSTQDTAKLKITGIIENESRGFFKAPDYNKHFIVARKQTANTPPFVNVLTGGNVMQNFYEDKLLFLGKMVPSPVSKQALTYYYFYIEKEIA
ncbi:MAG: carboxypeptidase-like regulatory domain-containing protein, partial [Ignavibacteriae bacterium]|nr:carboxypeptidase-like regulatory domain-containing protein [Ignavibacteriota bacterium]